ncbi:Tetratricopeptide repeat protein [Planctomycetes bacterium CA13]|uniref:Tetratricopeptide repeat protein n=1 Tax=Novipirellula herctigrandis TaxID=2527986 RepID=A0A5C5YP11_9BACT|nr:Tetratricopeptide repeat protein [Planctomycetes bacterium CA13]
MDPDDTNDRDEQADRDEKTDSLDEIRVALVGRFGSMSRREAANVLRSFGATVVDQKQPDVDWVVIGADQSPLAEAELLTESTQQQIAIGARELIHETELWQRIGLLDLEQSNRQYYTPAMLAHLLGVSVRVVRRWHRLGLITPVETLHRLPYFDFAEITTAKRLARWIAEGESATAIEHRLVELVELLPNIHRPLDQLSILIEGKHVLLRGGEGLIEPGGQMRFDFDSLDDFVRQDHDHQATTEPRQVLSMVREEDASFPSRRQHLEPEDSLLTAAYQAEDEGNLQRAIDYYHAILSRDGAHADICFQIGELLYRLGEPVAARERYYAAIELDPEFVEARASLGIVLNETGQLDLAIAAFRGALQIFPDYCDVHYHLARILDETNLASEATHHWKRFLELFPDSPWAEEAKMRLEDRQD